MDERADRAGDSADELLRRALIDPEQSIAVALKVEGLALTEALTVAERRHAAVAAAREVATVEDRGAGPLGDVVRLGDGRRAPLGKARHAPAFVSGVSPDALDLLDEVGG